MDIETKFGFGFIVGIWAIWLLVWAGLSGLIYAAVHFISKFW